MTSIAAVSDIQAPMAEVRILASVECPGCRGAGIIPDPACEAFNGWWDEYRRRNGTVPTVAELQAYAAENDLPGAPPPDLQTCPACGGAKHIQRAIDLDELARMIREADQKRLTQRVEEFQHQLAEYRQAQRKEPAFGPGADLYNAAQRLVQQWGRGNVAAAVEQLASALEAYRNAQ